MRRPAVIGPNGLRYIEYFLGLLSGSGLDTTAKLELVGLINGFAIMYGGMEATLASTGASPDQHQAAQVAAIVSAAASGQYPNLAAALAASEPSRIRDTDEMYDSVVHRLVDGALAGVPGGSPPRGQHSPARSGAGRPGRPAGRTRRRCRPPTAST